MTTTDLRQPPADMPAGMQFTALCGCGHGSATGHTPTINCPVAPVPVTDLINHPPHYTRHPSGVECITITEHMGFNLGNAIKYVWRADLKGQDIDDLRKAAWYVNREIERRLASGQFDERVP